MIGWSPAFLARTYGWPTAQIGAWLGTALLFGPLVGMPLHGAFADFLFRRGVKDVHLRYPMITALVGLPIAMAGFLAPNPYAAVVLIGLFFFVICTYSSLPIVALQAVLPSVYRTKASAVMLIFINLCATSLGPFAVAVITDHVLRDPSRLQTSLLIFCGICLPLVAILFGLALGPLRRFHAAMESSTGSVEVTGVRGL